LLTVPFDPLQAFFLSLMVNARHLFYGLALLPKYRGLGKLRPYLVYAMCDETFSIVNAVPPPPGMEPGLFYGAVTVLNHFYWVAATFAGGVLGSLAAFDTGGLDFALTALFVVLFLEQWKRGENRKPAVLGLACAAACLLIFGGGWFLLPAMGSILTALLIGRRFL
ncbi:MAG: AzlC family ABC transporter permease, partial [Clostridia bacterium]|nr:AzlC family ABC transporter permease [Clostridia bacterium]